MKTVLKSIVRNVMHRFHYAVLDLEKDQWLGRFLPGHLKHMLDTLSINCVIDVGANRGDYAAMLRDIGYRGRLVSIEPLADVYKELAGRAAPDDDWWTMNFALGEKDESREFNIFGAQDLSSFLQPSQHMAPNINNSNVTRVETVEVRRLDSVFKEITKDLTEPRIFLKLDTQGYDLEVMKGAGAHLSDIQAIQSEISVVPLYEEMPDYLEALRYYRELGFEPTGFFTVGTTRQSGHIIEFDAVLTRRQPLPSEADAQAYAGQLAG